MPLETPVSILYNSDGFELAVSGGSTPPVSSSAFMVAGIDPANAARVLKTTTDGTLFVTGTITTSDGGTVTATQGNQGTIAQSWYVQLTNGSAVIGTNIGNALFVTGAVTVTQPVAVSSISGIVTQSSVRAATSAITSVARNAASTTILAANGARFGGSVYNDSNSILFLRLATGTATTTTGYSVKVGAHAYFEIPSYYSGIIVGIWASAGTGNALITEFTQ